jgi:hypothetical protein
MVSVLNRQVGKRREGAERTEFNPECRAPADARRDSEPSAAAFDYLPDESEAEAGALSALLLSLLCLIKCRCVREAGQHRA